jgi:hypothetical protein
MMSVRCWLLQGKANKQGGEERKNIRLKRGNQ